MVDSEGLAFAFRKPRDLCVGFNRAEAPRGVESGEPATMERGFGTSDTCPMARVRYNRLPSPVAMPALS